MIRKKLKSTSKKQREREKSFREKRFRDREKRFRNRFREKRRKIKISELNNHSSANILLQNLFPGLLEVIGSPQPILAIVGDDIILPCHLRPAMDVASKIVEWMRPDMKPRFVHVWYSGQDLVHAQHPSYKGRTSLFINELKNGNVSLKLSKVRLSDKGKYRCFLSLSDIHSTVELGFGKSSIAQLYIYSCT
uniref:Ig-like domain-containing protein n=1 Tax=Labrus bergylta TaxID=56723 RepID=A0A3Q3FKS8_9LABR